MATLTLDRSLAAPPEERRVVLRLALLMAGSVAVGTLRDTFSEGIPVLSIKISFI